MALKLIRLLCLILFTTALTPGIYARQLERLEAGERSGENMVKSVKINKDVTNFGEMKDLLPVQNIPFAPPFPRIPFAPPIPTLFPTPGIPTIPLPPPFNIPNIPPLPSISYPFPFLFPPIPFLTPPPA